MTQVNRVLCIEALTCHKGSCTGTVKHQDEHGNFWCGHHWWRLTRNTETPRKTDKRKRERVIFTGFTQEDVNMYFSMPNMFMNIMAEIDSIAELKVVIYIMRHTWGFHEYNIAKWITVEEIMNGRKCREERLDNGTGLSEQSVHNGLALAEEHGYIVNELDNSDRARTKKAYKLRVKEGVQIVDPTKKVGVQSLESGVQSLEGRGTKSLPRSEKDTLERQERKRESVSTPTLPQSENTLASFSDAELIALCQQRGIPLSENPVSRDYTTTSSIEPVTTNAHTPIELSTPATPIVDNSPPSTQPSHSQKSATRPATHVGKAPVMAIPLPPGSEEMPVVTPPPSVQLVKPQRSAPRQSKDDDPSDGAQAIRRMYDKAAGYITGHADWEWKKMEQMAKDLQEAGTRPTEKDMKLVYNHLKPSGKYTITHVWESWGLLPTLRKTGASYQPKAFNAADLPDDVWA